MSVKKGKDTSTFLEIRGYDSTTDSVVAIMSFSASNGRVHYNDVVYNANITDVMLSYGQKDKNGRTVYDKDFVRANKAVSLGASHESISYGEVFIVRHDQTNHTLYLENSDKKVFFDNDSDTLSLSHFVCLGNYYSHRKLRDFI